jgi:thymidylate synthase (FAD)
MKIQFVKTQVFPQGVAPAEESAALRLIEVCGRTAYKSEDKISESSAKSFVLMLKKHRHLSVLEHSNIVLKIANKAGISPPPAPQGSFPALQEELVKVLRDRNAYHRISLVQSEPSEGIAFAGNLRSWIETLEYLRDRHAGYHALFSHHLSRSYPNLFPVEGLLPEQSHQFTITVMDQSEQLEILKRNPASDLPVFVFKFVCDRGITHEVVRHRVLSFTQESTRYVNYRNAGMTLILPEELYDFFDAEKGEFLYRDPLVGNWLKRAETIFEWYLEDLKRGLKPQIARDILPNLLKSEIFVSGRWSGWKHFVALRDTPQAHPRIREIAKEVRRYFNSIGIDVNNTVK